MAPVLNSTGAAHFHSHRNSAGSHYHAFDLPNKNIKFFFCSVLWCAIFLSIHSVFRKKVWQNLKLHTFFFSMCHLQTIEDKGEFSVPSCYGNIKNDSGGSSLTFEDPLDDVNVVDLKWIHDFVLKSLELLYQVEKWETLVSLAIQFNTISQ